MPSTERINMIWNTESSRVASRPATAITTISVNQPAIQAAAWGMEGAVGLDMGAGWWVGVALVLGRRGAVCLTSGSQAFFYQWP
jgi:hypothetical protein